jgi:hypothetical protein
VCAKEKKSKMFKKLVLNLCVVVTIVKAFPDGAPADVCVKMRANEPNHGKARSQAIESLPFQVVATTDKYQPGSQIQGEVPAFKTKAINERVLFSQ